MAFPKLKTLQPGLDPSAGAPTRRGVGCAGPTSVRISRAPGWPPSPTSLSVLSPARAPPRPGGCSPPTRGPRTIPPSTAGWMRTWPRCASATTTPSR